MQKYKKGLFITFEGLDGSGKTTQIDLLDGYLKKSGYKVVKTREPGGTSISEKIRSILLDNANAGMDARCEMLLYAAARAQLVSDVIRPALEDGSFVICDRFIDSSYVYQGMGRGLGTAVVEDVNKAGMDGLMPDLTYFMDIGPEKSLIRIESEETDRIESEKRDFHDKVYNGYLELVRAYPERIKAIDCSTSVDKIHKTIIEHMEAFL